MSTQLPATISGLVSSIEETAASVATESGGFAFLKLTKAGEWIFGADEVEVEAGSLWAVNINSFAKGFQAWDDGDLEGEEIRLVTEPPVLRNELESGLNWQPLLSVQLACISGEDKGIQVVYKTISKGGLKAIKSLMDEVVKEVKSNPSSGMFTPIIKLEKDSYKHKKYGKIYTPELNVMSWSDGASFEEDSVDEEDGLSLSADEPEAIEEAEVVEPEPEEPAPARRRRSRR